MRLIVPFVEGGLRPEAMDALHADGQHPELHRLEGETAYYDLLASLWTAEEDLVIVEQDIVVRPGCIAELAACECDWAKFGYWYPPFGYYGGLGCTRFSRFLQHWVPGALEVVAGMRDEIHPPRHWCRLDAWLQATLWQAGEREHYHEPPVTHLSERTDHRCEPGHLAHAV